MSGPAEGEERAAAAIIDRYADEIHPAYRDDFARLAVAAHDLDDPSPAALAALDKTAAYMAQEDRPYTDIEEEYGVGPSSVHYHLDDLHHATGLDMSFNGHPRKILDAAAGEAAELMAAEEIGKLAAAERVAPRHGVDPSSVKKRIPGESPSRFATDGTTERMYRALGERPHTSAELRDAFDLRGVPGNYIGRRDDVDCVQYGCTPPDGGQVVVWYREEDKQMAQEMADLLREEGWTAVHDRLAAPAEHGSIAAALDAGDAAADRLSTAVEAERPETYERLYRIDPGAVDSYRRLRRAPDSDADRYAAVVDALDAVDSGERSYTATVQRLRRRYPDLPAPARDRLVRFDPDRFWRELVGAGRDELLAGTGGSVEPDRVHLAVPRRRNATFVLAADGGPYVIDAHHVRDPDRLLAFTDSGFSAGAGMRTASKLAELSVDDIWAAAP